MKSQNTETEHRTTRLGPTIKSTPFCRSTGYASYKRRIQSELEAFIARDAFIERYSLIA